MLLEEESGI